MTIDPGTKSGPCEQRRNGAFLGAAAVAAALLGAYLWEGANRALVAGSEARYAEIAREMFASGDWLTPRYYGFAHLHKPPVTYWLTALGFQLFGVSELAARFFVVISALLGVYLTASIGTLLFGARAGALSGAVLASSGLWLVMGQTLTTDMYLATLTILAYWAFFKTLREASRAAHARLFWACLGLSVMTKMQAGILIIAAPIAAWALVDARGARLLAARLRVWPDGILIFSALAVPWYLALILESPELLRYWVLDHVVGRFFVEAKYSRGGPIYYFLPVLLVGFLPWVAYLRPALTEAWRDRRPELRLLLLWFALPLLVFSLSRSKLPPYILPLLSPLSLLVGRYWDRQLDGESAPKLAFRGCLALTGFSLLVAAGLWLAALRALPSAAPMVPVSLAMIACGPLAFALKTLSGPRREGRAAFAGLAAGACLLWLCGLEGARRLEPELSPFKRLAAHVRSVAAEGDVVAEYKVNTAGLPFYLGRIPVLWKEHLEIILRDERSRESELAKERWPELQGHTRGAGKVYLVTSRAHLSDLWNEPVLVEVLREEGRYALVVVKARPDVAAARAAPCGRC